jgi:hypothetical protein
MRSPWALIPVALALALAWWPLRRASTRTMWSATAALGIALAALPWIADRASLAALFTLALIAAAALPAKLIDGASAPDVWTSRPWREWGFFLSLPFVVCFRGHLRDPERPRRESALLVLRGLLEIAAGVMLLGWAFQRDWRGTPVVAEHAVKLAGLYLFALDGSFVLATGVLRLSGFAVRDLSRHPIAATTPADFWRRYNCDAGRFLRENVFRRLPMRSPAARTMVVFVLNGLLHEYLAWVMCGRILGYPLAFFSLQGLAVVLTARRRPTGLAALASGIATLIFMAAASTLILLGVDAVVPWYQRR